MECRRCGAEVPEESRYCPRCGEPVANDAPTPAGATGEGPDAADAAAGAAGRVAHGAMNAAVQGVQAAADRLNEVAGGSGHVDLRFADFFEEVFRRHEPGTAEELFVCGTPSTTPAPADISRDWPHPWLYSRVFLVVLAALGGLWVVTGAFKNVQGFVGFALAASLLMNLTMVMFFFETNAPRNVSFPLVLAVFLLGGVLSLVVASPFYEMTLEQENVGWLVGAVVGEVAKVICLVLALPRLRRGSWILTGMLVGAAVGAGYSVFSALGDPITAVPAAALPETEEQLSILFNAFATTFTTRVVSGLGYHAALGAIEGGALALAGLGGSDGGRASSLNRGVLAPFIGISLALAALWNVGVPILKDMVIPGLPTDGLPTWALNAVNVQGALLTVAAWVVIVVLLHRGLAQVNEAAAAMPDAPGEG